MKISILKILGWSVLLWGLLAGCSSGQGSKKRLIVATAANVQYAMQEIKTAFEEKEGINIEVIASSSGKLTAQIQQGAPYDLLVSADIKYPADLYEKGFAAAPPAVYAYGTLVLWTMKDLSLDSVFALLLGSAVKKIAIANPKVAPYGKLTFEWFKHHDLLNVIEGKLVFGESIAQASQYILSGASDLGFTARSIVNSPGMSGKGNWVSLQPNLRLEQGVVITTHGQKEHLEEAQRFYNFLFSEEAQNIFSRHGYETP